MENSLAEKSYSWKRKFMSLPGKNLISIHQSSWAWSFLNICPFQMERRRKQDIRRRQTYSISLRRNILLYRIFWNTVRWQNSSRLMRMDWLVLFRQMDGYMGSSIRLLQLRDVSAAQNLICRIFRFVWNLEG